MQNNGQDSLLYGYSDFQGSLIALTDESGTVIEKYAYDPWGARRDPTDWTQKDIRTKWITNRGYTGHEHLDAFGIINMNGRVYDPLTAMFFSPDPYVQAPDNWLNYNRYGYCYGNPFRYTDPNGEFFFTLLASIIPGAQFLLPIAIGADIGWMTGGMRAASQEQSFWSGAWKGAVVGAVGGMSAMIGGGPFLQNVLWGAGGGALTGGLGAALWGNNIGQGMLYGAASGAVFAAITSPEVNNWVQGKGFKSNNSVLNDFRAGKYTSEGGVWQQDALDYFGFEGSYNPLDKGP